MVKISKIIKKKTEGRFLVVYEIYGSLGYTDSKKLSCLGNCHFLPPGGWWWKVTDQIEIIPSKGGS